MPNRIRADNCRTYGDHNRRCGISTVWSGGGDTIRRHYTVRNIRMVVNQKTQKTLEVSGPTGLLIFFLF
jgi:hypothetical protein